ncbi:MAG: ABC transporter ATP-binding protein [Clostridia bacterium]|nr:ABC transporter ATP-binding protein [Clostridia bacterium]
MKKPGEYKALLRSITKEWKWLLRYVSKYRAQIILYIVIGVIGTLTGLGVSVASKHLIDAVVNRSAETIFGSAAFAVGFALLQIVLTTLMSRIATLAGTKISNEVRGNIYEHVIFSDWSRIGKYHSGDLLNRIEGDAGAISNSIVTFIPGIFTKLTTFIGCLALVLYYDPTMAIFALMSAPFLVLTSKITTKTVRKYNKQSREINGTILSYVSESVQNLQTIKAFNITNRYVSQMRTHLEHYRSIRLRQDKFSLIMSFCLSVIGLIVSYSCYAWGVYRLWNGAITYGTMLLFLQISGQLTTSFSSLAGLFPSAISIATAAGRIMEITGLSVETDSDGEKAEAIRTTAEADGISVACENVTYTYNDAEQSVLNEISFTASPGETIALVGPSGEGKTTILRLILGLVKPDSGRMTVSTKGGKQLGISDSTRRFCAYVPQGNAVFSGTIADNLRIVRPEATQEEIEEVLKIAEAWSFIDKLPQKTDTVIGERGVNFSEGQIQRISIARALLRNAPVLVMDEATSALDAETEEKVLGNMMKAYPNRTCIITTHRPSMLNYCNRVYRLNESGNLTLYREA